MNKVAAILLAFFVWGKPLSALQIFGLLVCITGGIAYSVFLKQDKAAAAKNITAKSSGKVKSSDGVGVAGFIAARAAASLSELEMQKKKCGDG